MKPNIIFFVTDQQRADWLSCAGNPSVETPNIDALAEDGVMFSRAYCNTPLCMPSRYSLWTGLQASEHGLRTNGVEVGDHLPTMPSILRANGYKTVSVGKIHLSSWHLKPELTPNVTNYDPEQYPESEYAWNEGLRTKLPDGYYGLDVTHFLGGHGGYCFGEYTNWLKAEHPDAYTKLMTRESERPSTRDWDNYYSTVPKALYYNEWIKNKSMEEIDRCPEDQPLFLWCSFPDPHFPFGPPAPYNRLYAPSEIQEPIAWDDERAEMNELYHSEYYEKRGIISLDGGPTDLTLDQIQETKALALGMVKSVDDSIGGVIQRLSECGRMDNSILVFISDHGELMGDHGLYCKGPFHYEGLLHVPLIISAPGLEHIQKGMRCESLASIVDILPTILELADVQYPLLEPEQWLGPKPEDRIYDQNSYLPGVSLVPLLTGTDKSVQKGILIENDDDVRGVYLRTIITERYKLTVYQGKPYGDFFDLQDDPDERMNLWDKEDAQLLKSQLMEQLLHLVIHSQPRFRRRIGAA